MFNKQRNASIIMATHQSRFKQISVFSTLLLVLPVMPALAEQNQAEDDQSMRLDAVTITGDAEARSRSPGSVHKIDEATLDQWHFTDVNRILEDVPGVYLRREDGYGLRPNIGMRGSDPERSKKITLMEDGLLFAPAPYAAPAAYFFPMMARMQAVEVFKGPSSIKYGPNTVGGAINFVSRDIPSGDDEYGNGSLDLGLGSYGFAQLHGFYGDSSERFGWLLEGVHAQADGFKELDGGGETGFDKNDIMLKLRFNSDPYAAIYHQFDIKAGYADETSHETYLGLTDDDFHANPVRRYVASSEDIMEWDRQNVSVNHFLDFDGEFTVNTTLYWNQFARNWDKIIGFSGASPELGDILADPNSLEHIAYYELLTGQRNTGNAQEFIVLGANNRWYSVLGIQSQLDWAVDIGGHLHEFNIGIRYHTDEVTRDHTEREFAMTNGRLADRGHPPYEATQNNATAQALALHLYDEVTLGDLTLSGGFRAEFISTEFINLKTDEKVVLEDTAVLPGFGLSYEVIPQLRLLAGVYAGFVPVTPGSDVNVEPEESINYEFGVRHTSNNMQAAVVGFFSDYSNMGGECTFAAGCAGQDLDVAFNAGEVDIYGIEADMSKTMPRIFNSRFSMPVRLVYTYTQSEFKTSFTSPRPDLAVVQAGDELPNLPEHLFTARVGLSDRLWQAALSFNYVAEMRTVAGTGEPAKQERTEAQHIVDFSLNYQLTARGQVYFTVDNVFDEAAIVARKPYGVRSGKPRTLLLGYKMDF